MKNTAILLMHCPDRSGVVATITDFLYKNNGNIEYLDQHVNNEEGIFYMRVEWSLDNFKIDRENIIDVIKSQFQSMFNMTFNVSFSNQKPRMAIFVSKMSHCLADILSRYSSGEWNVDIPLVISNHEDLRGMVEIHGIEYHYIPITKDSKAKQEAKEKKLLLDYDIDFIALARYMQILSDNFINDFPQQIINIHHSFLPAFVGAKPYHAAHHRGVKIIGATSHYVTAELDAGPIIEQDITRITHADTVESLVRKGRDLEKIVLSRALFKHIERKVLAYNNRTVVFS